MAHTHFFWGDVNIIRLFYTPPIVFAIWYERNEWAKRHKLPEFDLGPILANILFIYGLFAAFVMWAYIAYDEIFLVFRPSDPIDNNFGLTPTGRRALDCILAALATGLVALCIKFLVPFCVKANCVVKLQREELKKRATSSSS